jgi:hypothetical protein
MQNGAVEIDLLPTKVHDLGGPQPMPKGDQDHRRIPMPVTVSPGRGHEGLDLVLGQVLTRAQVAVLGPLRRDCSFCDSWDNKLEMRITHENPPAAQRHCSDNSHFRNSFTPKPRCM